MSDQDEGGNCVCRFNANGIIPETICDYHKRQEAELAALQAERGVDIRYMDECKAERNRLRSLVNEFLDCPAVVYRDNEIDDDVEDEIEAYKQLRQKARRELEVKARAELAEERKYNGTKEDIRTLTELLEHRNVEVDRLLAILETIAACGKDGICPYGCDCPNIARKALGGKP